jgi:hypothetical protein
MDANYDPPFDAPVASRYLDCAIPALRTVTVAN